MSTALAVYLILQKLEALKDKEVNNPRLKCQIENTKETLGSVQKLLTNSQKNISDENLERNPLKEIYSLEDTIDTFFVKTTLQKQKISGKVRVFSQFMPVQSQILVRRMRSLTEEIDKRIIEYKERQSVENKDEGAQESNTDDQKGVAGEKESMQNETPTDSAEAGIISKAAQESNDVDQKEVAADKESMQNETLTDSAEAGIISKAAQESNDVDQKEIAADKESMQNKTPTDSAEAGAISKERRAPPQQLGTIADRSDDESEFVGRESEAEKLEQAILNRRKLRFLISVVGAAGSGKTSFVRNIYNKANVVQHFQLRAWVNLSEEFPESVASDAVEQKMKNLIIDILKLVTTIKDEEKLQPDKLEEKARDFFFRKRYLIVLDDVKTDVMWENLKRTFPNSLNGSRLIFITRDKKIAELMNDQGSTPIELPNLDIDQSWKLFLKKVPKTEESLVDASLKELIWQKCSGLPLAIVVLGGLLSTKDTGSWKDRVERLSFGDDPSKAILALAYQELPSALKLCLLYLGIFPKEYVIPVRRLFHLWAAEGLVNESLEGKTPEELEDASVKGKTPEELVERYLNALITRNMIEVARWRLDGSPRTCRVPGILYDNVFPNATDSGFYDVIRSSKYQQTYSIRRVAAYVDISSSPLDIDNLRSYISFNTRKGDTPADEVDKFLTMMIRKRGFSLLTVLDLENVYKPVLSDQAIGKLVHLTYLGLRWTFLDSIPNSVGDLPNLEILDVKHTNINSLPISIWNSKKLRHLYMNEIYLNVSFQKPLGSGSLGNLLTLWGLIIGKKSPGEDWLNSLVRLMKLGLTFHFKSLEQISPWISKCKELRSLKLRSIDEFSRPSELKLESMNKHDRLSELYLLGKLSQKIEHLQLPKNLKMVTLSVSNLTEDPMQTLGELPQLKILRLFARSYIGKEMTCKAKGFPELRVLKLWMLEELEKWIVQEGSMLRLRELEIRRCDKLKETSGWQQLNSLKELILTNMSEDFVAEMESTMKERNVKITKNNWKFDPLPSYLSEGQS